VSIPGATSTTNAYPLNNPYDTMEQIIEAGCFVRTTNKELPYTAKACETEDVLDVTSAPSAPDMEIVWICSSLYVF
jgi:hypothetical protein